MTYSPNPQTSSFDRRDFLQASAALGAGLWASGVTKLSADDAETRKLNVGVMGLSRGLGHVDALLKMATDKNVEIAYLCEVDSNRLERGQKIVTDKIGKTPQGHSTAAK